MRIRTHKNPYTTISNAAVRDEDLSWEAVGFLAYCLSMPEDWEFHPKQIWKKNTGKGAGINKIYALINELIEHKKCIRVQNGQLKNSYTYEMIDDEGFYDQRVKELRNSDQIFLYAKEKGTAVEAHGKRELKEKVQRHDFQNAEIQHAENSDNTKKEETKKKAIQSTTLPSSKKVEPEPKARAATAGEKIFFKDPRGNATSIDESLIYRKMLDSGFPTEVVAEAIGILKESDDAIGNVFRFIEAVCIRLVNSSKKTKNKKKLSEMRCQFKPSTGKMSTFEEVKKRREEEDERNRAARRQEEASKKEQG